MVLYESTNLGDLGDLTFFHPLLTKNLDYFHHLHRCYELAYVKEGSLSVTVDGQTRTITEGSAVLVLPYQIHSSKSPEPSLTRLFLFSAELVEAFSRAEGKLYAEDPVFRLSERGLEAVRCLEEAPPEDVYTLRGGLYLLCGEYCRSVRLTEREGNDNRLLNNILLFIEKHFKEDITLDALAKSVGYDYQYISRYVTKHLGIPFSQYLAEYRIHYACRLLLETPSPVGDIAAECGYGTVRNFNRAFLKLTGRTPRAYRQQSHPRAAV